MSSMDAVAARRTTRTAMLGGRLWLAALSLGYRLSARRATRPDPDQPATAPGASASQADSNRPDAARDFDAFVRSHERDLFTYLWRMTGDEQAAYDLRQEAFIAAWRHFARVRAYEKPVAWLFRVATNAALNELRSRRAPHNARLFSALDTQEPSTSDPSWSLAERDLVRVTLLALPERERAALALREGQGLTYEEVAQALGMTPAAARTLLWRAREHFRAAYDRANRDAPAADPGESSPDMKGGAR